MNRKNILKISYLSKVLLSGAFFVFLSILLSCTNEKENKENIQGMKLETLNEILPSTESAIHTNTVKIVGKDSIMEETKTFICSYPSRISVTVDNTPPPPPIEPDYNCDGTDDVPLSEGSAIKSKKDSAHSEIIMPESNRLSTYPNPSSGEFTIQYNVLKGGDVFIEIHDANGELIKVVSDIHAQQPGKYEVAVNMKNVSPGIYIVSLLNEGEKITQKIIIQ